MNKKKQRIAIAKACGWKIEPMLSFAGEHMRDIYTSPNGICVPDSQFPDYLNDLNAMREAEETLLSAEGSGFRMITTDDQEEKTAFVVYKNTLRKIVLKDKLSVYPTHYDDLKCLRATAAQRAEAFLKTLNLWRASTQQ